MGIEDELISVMRFAETFETFVCLGPVDHQRLHVRRIGETFLEPLEGLCVVALDGVARAHFRMCLPNIDLIVNDELLFGIGLVFDCGGERFARFIVTFLRNQRLTQHHVRVCIVCTTPKRLTRHLFAPNRIVEMIAIKIAKERESVRHKRTRRFADELEHFLERAQREGVVAIEVRGRPKVVPVVGVFRVILRRQEQNFEIALPFVALGNHGIDVSVMDQRDRTSDGVDAFTRSVQRGILVNRPKKPDPLIVGKDANDVMRNVARTAIVIGAIDDSRVHRSEVRGDVLERE